MKYRKKPVIVEAQELKLNNVPIVAKWCSGEQGLLEKRPGVFIKTLEGRMFGEIGDFVIKGVQGEFYPCKPDIFEETYELVTYAIEDMPRGAFHGPGGILDKPKK